jgi:hypothetical protein
VRDTIFCIRKIFQAMKVPRQCPLVFLVEEIYEEGKALGNEESKAMGIGFSVTLYCKGKKLCWVSSAFNRTSRELYEKHTAQLPFYIKT